MFEIEIIDITEMGSGVGKLDGFTWFIDGAVPGDVVLAKPTQRKKNFGKAVVESFVKKSDLRVDPPCPIFEKCGGCQIQQIDYKEQLRIKRRIVKEAFERIGGFQAVEVPETIGMESPWRYRNKGIYHVGQREGQTVIGFYSEKSHHIVALEDCLIQSESHGPILKAIKKYIEEFNISTIREVVIRESEATGQIMVILVAIKRKLNMTRALVEMLLNANKKIESIYLNVNPRDGQNMFGDHMVDLFEKSIFVEKLGPYDFEISPLSFFQVNTKQALKLYEKALEFAGLSGNEIVYDLYCGTGTLAIFMASHAKKVYGVEVFAPAIEDAKRNAQINGIDNIEWIVGKTESVMEALVDQSEQVDVIVLDPPRSGCDQAVIDSIKKALPHRIVYVSCKPSTLARDVKLLSEVGYEPLQIQPVDLFGHSMHVETVCLLTRK